MRVPTQTGQELLRKLNDHSTFSQTLHTASFWLSVLSALLTVLVQGLHLIPASDQSALYVAGGIIVAAVLGGSYAAGKHAQAAGAMAQAAAVTAQTPAQTQAPAGK